ncbi:MAG: hypothetical protein DRQ78_05960 [Epsilonproteobacteria bacterium]|nr:MAG: hypothetical protein DRQ78_05960 [Campylobacterota bacterium]
MYESICVIGVGTVGGFLCKYLSEQKSVEKITIVDYDIVSTRDIFRSVYSIGDVGEYKVVALANKLRDVEVTTMQKKFIDKDTKLPTSDIVIDCRDVIAELDPIINVKLYISSKYLVINTKLQNDTVLVDPHSDIQLRRNQIKKLCLFASELICSEVMPEILQKKMYVTFNADEVIHTSKKKLLEFARKRLDVLYEGNILNIDEISKQLLKTNQCQDLTLITEEHEKIIPMNYFEDYKYVVEFLLSLQLDQKHKYILVLEEDDRVVRLIRETSAT